ncbi:MAG: glycine betaine/L-proline ABC transporter ATP-binding protein [Anaerolineae bacterium]|nr:glycine betaine/L-proline ABC transporter ATP-binding protein [Anaerolineae bacterium]
MATAESNFKVSCRKIWKIFGPHPEQVKQLLKPDMSRAEILEETGHVVAVKNVSFGVRAGETFVVMGLSGSGKSTLVRCISRLIEPTSGQIIIEGEDVTAMSEAQLRLLRRRKMSMVFQHFGLFPHRKVIDNVAYGLEIQGVEKSTRHTRAQTVLDLVSLTGWENHYPGELSGGMQQRVGIARALAVDPEILFFDEPFSALDPLIRREMQDELIKLQKMMQKTIIFITHDFLEAVKLGDDIAIMKDGEIVQVGTPDQIILNPANDYVREFTKDVPRSRVLSARAIMQPCEVICSENESPERVQVRLQNRPSRVAFINAENGRFLGIVSRDQIDQAVPTVTETVRPLVNDHQPTVSPHTFLSDLLSIVAATDLPVPVVDSSRNLLGSVDRAAVIMALGGAMKES